MAGDWAPDRPDAWRCTYFADALLHNILQIRQAILDLGGLSLEEIDSQLPARSTEEFSGRVVDLRSAHGGAIELPAIGQVVVFNQVLDFLRDAFQVVDLVAQFLSGDFEVFLLNSKVC